MEKGKEFAIVCLDGFSPSLTMTSMVNGEGESKAGIVGKGTIADAIVCIAGICGAVLDSGIMTKEEILKACFAGIMYAELRKEEDGGEEDAE